MPTVSVTVAQSTAIDLAGAAGPALASATVISSSPIQLVEYIDR